MVYLEKILIIIFLIIIFLGAGAAAGSETDLKFAILHTNDEFSF